MPIDPLHSFITSAPPAWVDSLDAWFEAQRLSSDVYAGQQDRGGRGGEVRGRKHLDLVSRVTDPRRGSYEELEENLHALAGRGKVHAMRAFAPYLASLTVDMLGGQKRAAAALTQLYSHETVWTDLVRAIFHSSEALIKLAETRKVHDFGQIVKGMHADMLSRLPYLLLEREGDVLTPKHIAELVGAWTWGPFEVARFLFDYRFGQHTSKIARLVRGDDVLPVMKSMEQMGRDMTPSQLFLLASKSHRFHNDHTSPRHQAVDAVMSLADTLGKARISPRVSIPSELEIVSGCPAQELQYIFIELLMNASKFRDARKPHNTISIVWDERQHAIVVRDNGIGIEKVNDVWPDKLSESNAFGSGVAMRGSLFMLRNRLKTLTWRMTLASEPGQWTEFTVYPRLGDIHDGRKERQLQPPSGPPIYGDDSKAPGIAATNDGPVSVDASTRLYSDGALAAAASYFPLRGLLR
jgi:hypothetical protein